MLNNSGNNNGIMAGGDVTVINNPIKLQSHLSKIINGISDMVVNDTVAMNNNFYYETFAIEDKICHNNIIKYREIIKEYSIFYDDCEKRLDILDDNDTNIKKKILHYAKATYQKVLTKYLIGTEKKINIIRNNADTIVEEVAEEIEKDIKNSSNAKDISCEDLKIAMLCLTCYFFMKCKILEKPN